jgi:hypothetical protein
MAARATIGDDMLKSGVDFGFLCIKKELREAEVRVGLLIRVVELVFLWEVTRDESGVTLKLSGGAGK